MWQRQRSSCHHLSTCERLCSSALLPLLPVKQAMSPSCELLSSGAIFAPFSERTITSQRTLCSHNAHHVALLSRACWTLLLRVQCRAFILMASYLVQGPHGSDQESWSLIMRVS